MWLKELSRQKFTILENDIILVYNNFSKTNQFMNRNSVIPLVKNSILALDPIFHLKKLFSNEISPEKPAFSYYQGETIQCITYDFSQRDLKHCWPWLAIPQIFIVAIVCEEGGQHCYLTLVVTHY